MEEIEEQMRLYLWRNSLYLFVWGFLWLVGLFVCFRFVLILVLFPLGENVLYPMCHFGLMAETDRKESTDDKVLMPWGYLCNIYCQKA